MRFTHAVLGASASCLVLLSSSVMAQSTAPAKATAAGTTAASTKAPVKLSSGDERFLDNTAQSNYSQFEGSKLALKKASSPKVKAYAQRMIKEHGVVQKELEALARRKGYTLPKEGSLAQRAQLKALGALSGADFEKMYTSHIAVAGHDNTVLAFQNATTQAEDTDIQAFAKKHVETLRNQLDAARQIGSTDQGM